MFFVPVYGFIKRFFGSFRGYLDVAVMCDDDFKEIPRGLFVAICTIILFVFSPLIWLKINRFM